MRRAAFVQAPKIVVQHTTERTFIGPGTLRLSTGEILMAAPWGRSSSRVPLRGRNDLVPELYRSSDGGRTWRNAGPMDMAWDLEGAIEGGGITLLGLRDGRIAFLSHRHVQGRHGGGLPAISFSEDDGRSWTPAHVVDAAPEGVWYVMNDRLIQMRCGRLVVPVSHMPEGVGTYEGHTNMALCFYSDDDGATWASSKQWAAMPWDDERGMQEPCIAELGDGTLLMLARTGSGWLFQVRSSDGGDTWSVPQPTALMSPCAPLTVKRMPDGRLVVLYNHCPPFRLHAFLPRNPLVYAISDDDGRTWSPPAIVDDEDNVWVDPGVEPDRHGQQHIYPSVCFTGEGILVVYSSHAAKAHCGFGPPFEGAWQVGGGKCCILAYPPSGWDQLEREHQ